MLVALDDKKERVYAFNVDKHDSKGNLLKYYCPECGEELILRKGNVYQHHFSHKSKDTICRLRDDGGESDIHNFLKYKIKKIIEKDNNPLIKSEIEYPIGSRIADYYCEFKDDYDKKRKVAVEIVHKHDNIKDFIDKNEYYYSKKVHCVWVFNIDKFTSKTKTVTSNIGMDEIVKNNSGDFKETINVTEIIRDAHVMNFGKVYALDPFNERIYGIHIESIHSTNTNKYPHNVVPLLLDDFKIKCSKPKVADGFLKYNRMPAGPYIERFWDSKPFDYIFKNKNNDNIKDKNQFLFKKEFYNPNAIKIECTGAYEECGYKIIYNDNNLIFYDKSSDYYFKYHITTIQDLYVFLEDILGIRETICINIVADIVPIGIFNDDGGVYYSEDGGVFKPDAEDNNNDDEFDDLIDVFSKDYVHKPTILDDEYISYEEYAELKSKPSNRHNEDMRIIPKNDKFCLIEFLDDDKKYLHGCYDTWNEADEAYWN